MLLQKTLMCFFLLSVTQKFENKDILIIYQFLNVSIFFPEFRVPWLLYR